MKNTPSIKANRDFKRLYHRGKSKVTREFVLYYLPKKEKTTNQLGITVTKKQGNAVKRNRQRRLLKEAYRLLEPEVKTGYFLVLVARSRLYYTGGGALLPLLRAALQEAGLLKEAPGSGSKG